MAIGHGADILAHERLDMRHGHAEALLPMIDRVAVAAGIAAERIDKVAVTLGPGGFTGIRAGLAAARAIALAARAELLGITSFAAVAALIGPGAPGAPLLVALDSRRDDLFIQLFDAEGTPLDMPAAVMPGDIADRLGVLLSPGSRLRIAGDAAAAAEAALAGRAGVELIANSAPDALGVLHAARRGATGAGCGEPVRPLYLRAPDVSLPRPRIPADAAVTP